MSESEISRLQSLLDNERLLRLEERKGRTKAESQLREIGVSTSLQRGFTTRTIGHVKTIFSDRRGTPRQGCLNGAKAKLELLPAMQCEFSLDGLEAFSHLWLIFVFDRNTNFVKTQEVESNNFANVKWKVAPPRLSGKKVGLFATRTPHRPNPIGLSLVEIVSIDKATSSIILRGCDLLDNTPIIDIKPYIPSYDSVSGTVVRVPEWINQSNSFDKSLLTKEAMEFLESYNSNFIHFANVEEFVSALQEILLHDIRSIHQRNIEEITSKDIDNECKIINQEEVASKDLVEPAVSNLGSKRKSNAKDIRRLRWASSQSKDANSLNLPSIDSKSESFGANEINKESIIYEEFYETPFEIVVESTTLNSRECVPITKPPTFMVRLDNLIIYYVVQSGATSSRCIVYKIITN